MDKNIKAIVKPIVLPDEDIDLKELERQVAVTLINQALVKHNGVVSHAAKSLCMGRTALVERIKRLPGIVQVKESKK